MKIVFLLPTVSQVRFQKRVNALRQLGVQPIILAFQRDYYPGKPWTEKVWSLGTIRRERYLRRIPTLLAALLVVRRFVSQADAIYAFGLDMLLLAWMARLTLRNHVRIICETGDIQEVRVGKSLESHAVQGLERYLVGQTHLLVVTSGAYVTGYYEGVLGLTGLRYQVIENKLDSGQLPPPRSLRPHAPRGVVRIGYFGVLRCRRSWETLKELAVRGNGRIRIYVRGVSSGIAALVEEAGSTPNVQYDGPYVAPDELPDMYGQIDLAWIASYHARTNVAWARVNRFYEACYFRVPMIAQTDSMDGRDVVTYDLGLCVDLAKPDEAVKTILEIGEAQLAKWQQNIAQLPETVYTYSDEHQALMQAIRHSQ